MKRYVIDENRQADVNSSMCQLKTNWPDFGTPVLKPAEDRHRWRIVDRDGHVVANFRAPGLAKEMFEAMGGRRAKLRVVAFMPLEEDIQAEEAKARANNRWQGGWGA